jgi:hypothetical protein
VTKERSEGSKVKWGVWDPRMKRREGIESKEEGSARYVAVEGGRKGARAPGVEEVASKWEWEV